MIRLTTEQAQQIEDALFGCRPTVISHENWNDVYKARAIITAAKAQEQAEQEPVAWYLDTFDEDGELDYREYNSSNKFSCGLGNGTPLYSAHVSIAKQSETDSSSSLMRTSVRTKDLTADEIWEALHDKGLMEGIRAVIAADREKNK